jgi:Flp pilus assembly protein TadG
MRSRRLGRTWVAESESPRADEAGAAAVELAIILPVLLLILLGILEFGREYSKYLVLQGAAREGARVAAVRADQATVVSRVYEAAEPYEPTSAPAVSTSSGSSQCDVLTKGQSVTVSWTQSFQLDIAFWDQVTFSRPIQGVFRCE